MNVGGRISVRLLLASLNDPEIHWLAVRILDRIGSRDVDALITALKDERTTWYAQDALARLDGAVMPQLEERLKGPDATIREGVARVMGKSGIGGQSSPSSRPSGPRATRAPVRRRR